MIYRKVENSFYFVSNSDRLLRDHKAWGDGDLVDVLSACDLDSRLTRNSNWWSSAETRRWKSLIRIKHPIDPIQRTNNACTNFTHHRVGCVLACACLYVAFTSSKPCVRAGKNHLSRPWGAAHDPLTFPCQLEGHLWCRSLLEIYNQFQIVVTTYKS